jgi:hypothetical protein
LVETASSEKIKKREQSLRMEGSRFKSKSPMCVCYLGLLMGLGEEMSNPDVSNFLALILCVCVSCVMMRVQKVEAFSEEEKLWVAEEYKRIGFDMRSICRLQCCCCLSRRGRLS